MGYKFKGKKKRICMDDYLENDNKGSPAVFSTIMKKKINIPYVYEPAFEVQNGRQ